MTKIQRDAQREARWRELLAQHAASGLSVRAFCQREQLHESSFYAWRRTIGERDRANVVAEKPPFVPAVVTSDAPAETAIAIELPAGCTLRLSGANAIGQLADLLIALQRRGAQ